jgi:hypothetical protein
MTQETVLLVHSGGFTSRQWRRLADLLAPTYSNHRSDEVSVHLSGSSNVGTAAHV